MKAVVCHDAKLELVELAEPEPQSGQVLLNITRCGICGSDLHARRHCDAAADVAAETGYDGMMRSDQQVVMGHELLGEIVGYGPSSRKKVRIGRPVVALPLVRRGGEIHPIGLSAQASGGYAERTLVEESLMLEVPNGLPPERAALTEPMAVGLHAVNRAEIKKRDVAIVVGCGPIGIAVICMLKAKGVRHIVASDFSQARRELAAACGADVVVDPGHEVLYASSADQHLTSMPELTELAVGAMERLARAPVPWHHLWRAAEMVGATNPKRPVIFECVGVPGIIDEIIAAAPIFSRVVVVGVCMTPDSFRPALAINKEIDLRFVIAYTPLEFRDTLHMLAEGKVDPGPVVTATVGLGGVDAAFDALADPEAHAKILIDPASAVTV